MIFQITVIGQIYSYTVDGIYRCGIIGDRGWFRLYSQLIGG